MSDQPFSLSRRTFLQLSSAGLSAGVLAQFLEACGDAESSKSIDVSYASVREWVRVRRPEDVLVVDFGLVNLDRFTLNGALHLRKLISTDPSMIVARFQPQHLHEQTYRSDPTQAPNVLPANHVLSDASRVVFVVDVLQPIPLTAEGLLTACASAGINVHVDASLGSGLPDVGGTTSGTSGGSLTNALDPLETAIELPFRLQLSPNEQARFSHPRSAATSRGRSELWTMRLGVGLERNSDDGDGDPAFKTMRALKDLGITTAPRQRVDPLGNDAPLSNVSRAAIVRASRLPVNPIRVRELALSTMGAWFDAELDVVPGSIPGTFTNWKHRTVMGRDVFVRVVNGGRLHPICHSAPLIETVERRFTDGPIPVAYLHVTREIKPVELLRTNYHDPMPLDIGDLQRKWPFSSVRLLTRGTGALDTVPTPLAPFQPTVNGQPFMWEVEARDRRGELVKFEFPFWWTPDDQSGPNNTALGDAQLGGKRVAMAEPFVDPDAPLKDRDKTTLEVHSLAIQGVPLLAELYTVFGGRSYPVVDSADVVIEALAGLAGSQPAAAPLRVSYDPLYLSNAFQATGNPHQVFMSMAGAAQRVSFVEGGADKMGGIAAPNLEVKGLSRVIGPVTSAFCGGQTPALDPTNVFPLPLGDALNAFCPRLFGCISLVDIISSAGVNLDDLAPKFATEAYDHVQRLRQTIDQLIADANTLATRLQTAVANTVSDLNAYAQELLNFFSTNHADYLQTKLEAAKTAIEAVLMDPLRIDESGLKTQVNDALEKLGSFAEKLNDARLAKLIEVIGFGGSILRTTKQVLGGLIETLMDAQEVIDLVWDTLAAIARAKKVLKDKTIKVEWRPKLVPSFGPSAFSIHFLEERGLLLSIEARAKQRGDQKAGADVLCSLERFELHLLSVLLLKFKRFQFRQKMGQKPEVDVVFEPNGIVFDGPLKFIETLKSILPTAGFSDPPSVKVDKNGIEASYSLAIPNVAVGVFSLRNMKIGASLHLPLLGDAPRFAFNFSTKEQPCIVTVGFLGGGGYFELECTPSGIRSCVFAIEFGACMAADLGGLISGSLSFMGGAYLRLMPGSIELCGFIEMKGAVDVLGLITASVLLYVGMTHVNGKLRGKARLEIEVSLTFFSTKVVVETERTLAGASSDPTFQDLFPTAADYSAYCDAFAA